MDFSALNEARLSAQYSTFGESATIGGLAITVCTTGHRNTTQLGAGGLEVDFARTVRARMADFPTPPREGTKAVIGSRIYRIADITTSHHAGEYIFTLEQQRG